MLETERPFKIFTVLVEHQGALEMFVWMVTSVGYVPKYILQCFIDFRGLYRYL